MPPTIVATAISVLSIALAVFTIEIIRQGDAKLLPMISHVTSALARNPMIVALCAGLVWLWTGPALAGPVQTFIGIVGAAAGPCALVCIGLLLVRKLLRLPP